MSLAPMSFWARYAAGNGKIMWDSAINALMSRAHAAGVYDPSRVRGRGAWIDNHRVVYHLGDVLLINGEERVAPNEIVSWWLYENAIAIPPPHHRALRLKEATQILKLAQSFRWNNSIAPYLLAGWCVLAPICGALDWRPHIWVSGGSGTGKTTLAKLFIRPLLGPNPVHAAGNTTEAGIRQRLGCDALPVLFDEAESNDPKSVDRIQQTLELMRQASADSGAKVLRGDPHGDFKEYEIRSCFALVSINPGVKQTADASRVSILTMLAPPAATDENKRAARADWEALQRKLELLTPQFCSRLFARTLLLVPVIRHNAQVFTRQIQLALGNARVGDQIGTLLAGAYSLESDTKITEERAREIILSHEWDEFATPVEERDELACLRHLMQHKMRVETTGGIARERTVCETLGIAAGRIIEEAAGISPEDALKALKRNGISLCRGDSVAIANNHSALATIFRNTGWIRYREQLTRLSFVTGRNQQIWIGGNTRATLLRLDDVLENA
jgi:putative DNA primase/helicase